jgi:gamma-glutamyltranspeptidase/glutathione hydrolase
MASAVVHLTASGRTFGIDGSCLAPERATPEEVAGSKRYRGYRAVAVPRYLAAIRHLHEGYGILSREEVLAPAIAIAEAGFPQTRLQQSAARKYRRPLAKSTAGPIFLDERLRPRPVGAVLRQPALARTLRRLAAAGLEDLYRGAVAAEIVEDVARNDGFLTSGDLARALSVAEVEPLVGSFDGARVATLGPPFGGPTLLQLLHMADSLPGDALALDVPQGVARVAALIRRARLDRRRRRPRAAREEAERAAREELDEPLEALRDDGETSHLVVFDDAGNTVSLTQSIERSFGAAVVTPSLGFLYNGYLRGFKVRNRRHPHYVRPHASARSNAAPTIVLDERGPVMALGSTGSERLSSGLFEAFLRLRRESPFAAVHGPRLHCTPDGEVLWERARFPRGCRAALVERGFAPRALGSYAFEVGGLQLALRRADGSFTGVSEPRRDGAAAGPR